MSKAVHTPDWSKNNPYQSLLKNSLKNTGWNVHFENYPEDYLPFYRLSKLHPDMQVLHIHWIADLCSRICWQKNPVKFYLRCFFIFLDLKLVRRKGIRVIWTIHNKISHQSLDPKKELIIRKIMLNGSDKVIVHSKAAVNVLEDLYQKNFSDKASVIFHGNYDGVYPSAEGTQTELKVKHGMDSESKLLLFFGAVRPYKGIENLISTFNLQNFANDKIKLVIAGNTPDETYKSKLTDLAQGNSNILLDFKYIPDQLLVNYLEMADIVVLPFSDTLTSGSVLLAMTLGKALILPESAKVLGCIPEGGALYFRNNEEFSAILSNINKIDTRQMGSLNLESSKKCNWDKVAKLTAATYID